MKPKISTATAELLLEACAAALVCVRGYPEFHAEEKMLNEALYAAGVRRVCNANIPNPKAK